jgi:hypothetical protein
MLAMLRLLAKMCRLTSRFTLEASCRHWMDALAAWAACFATCVEESEEGRELQASCCAPATCRPAGRSSSRASIPSTSRPSQPCCSRSGYAETSALLQDVQLLIQTGERPPDKRVLPILERVKTDRGDYWRYPRPRP